MSLRLRLGWRKLAQRLRLDLADALAGDLELLPDFFERAAAAIVEAEAQVQHFPLAHGQRVEHVLHLLFEQSGGWRPRRGRGRC